MEVSDSNAEDAVWTTIATADMPEGTDLNLKKTVDVKENGKAREIPRYIRLYIRKQSGGKPQYRGAGISGDWNEEK